MTQRTSTAKAVFYPSPERVEQAQGIAADFTPSDIKDLELEILVATEEVASLAVVLANATRAEAEAKARLKEAVRKMTRAFRSTSDAMIAVKQRLLEEEPK